MFSKYLINILLLCTAALVNAGDDYCWDVKSVDELQQAIGEQLEKDSLQEGHPTVVSLCKGTKVLFKKGDKPIKFPELGENLSFVLKCEESGTCTMDGGILQKKERLFVGDGGFSIVTISAGSLFIEGIVFQNFGVTGYGGIFIFELSGSAKVYIYKCVFFESIAKGAAGGAILVSGSNYVLFRMEAVHFKGNKCPNGFGGAVTVNGEVDFQIEKGILNHNEAYSGGAISFYSGKYAPFQMTAVEFGNNKAGDEGGAIYFGHAICEWIGVAFKGNSAHLIGEAYFQFEESDMRAIAVDYNKDKLETWMNPSRAVLVF